MKKLNAFTMAEILLSLTIIGVVAAITLPSLTGNINERTWNTQRKALYARMSQAIALMPALNGYGTLKEESSAGASDAVDTATETFITEGLAKVLKINNICDSEHLEDCGIVTSYTNMAGSQKAMAKKLSELNSAFTESVYYNSIVGLNPQNDIDTKAAAFETQNGESIIVFYNPSCISPINTSLVLNTSEYTQTFMCANFIYDLNGNKGPNTVGKDIGFMSALYPSDSSVVAPHPTNSNVNSSSQMNFNNARSVCKSIDNESRLPNIEELASMFYNRDLIGIDSLNIWSSSFTSADLGWYLRFSTGERVNTNFAASSCYVRCVKR